MVSVARFKISWMLSMHGGLLKPPPFCMGELPDDKLLATSDGSASIKYYFDLSTAVLLVIIVLACQSAAADAAEERRLTM